MSSEATNYTYKEILKDFRKFRQGATREGSPESTFDIPNHSFFKILWHFNNQDPIGQGLLHPTWLSQPHINTKNHDKHYEDLWEYSSAYNYLLQNDELTRSQNLKRFIELLSSINIDSPWYWQSIKGIEEAIQRKQREEMMWKDPYTITIECLEDSVDQRLGTLLDLYRSVVWSWERKCEILPVNLRRFDMSILVFSSPLRGLHILQKPSITQAMGSVSKWLHIDTKDYADFTGVGYKTSYKQYDLINCEIDYASSSGGAEGLSNTEGFQQKYNLTIKFTDIRESRYNEFNGIFIEDLAPEDILSYGFSSTIVDDENDYEKEQDEYIESVKESKAEIKYKDRLSKTNPTITSQLWGLGTGFVSSQVNSIALGNMYGLSLTKIGNQVGDILNGNVGASYQHIRGWLGSSGVPYKPSAPRSGDLGKMYVNAFGKQLVTLQNT